MSKNRTHDESGPTLPEQATEIQSPDGLNLSVDLSIPKHVIQHSAAPKLGGYVLTDRLGEGAYGQVWRAWQIRTRKEVAVKAFKQHSGLDWIFLQREVERLLRLDRHPHVVTLLDAGLESDPPYYVVDLLTGGSLEQFVNPQQAAPPPRVMAWTRQMCDALGYVHQKGLIHCDLKPANVLIDEQDRVRVVDFGQSRVFTESAASLGTLFYMAPEQAVVTELGKPVHPDVRWDIYALGATLFSLLTGQVPYATAGNRDALQQAGSLGERLERYRGIIGSGPVADDAAGLRARAGEELAAVVAKCMAVRPEERYASMAEVSSDLDAIANHRPVSPLAHRRGYRLSKFVRRNPFGVALAGCLLVLAAGAYSLRGQLVRADRAKAADISATFVHDPAQAVTNLTAAGPRVRRFLAEDTARHLNSPAYTERIMGARNGLWANPAAFWAGVDGGPLWRSGEWLELAMFDWPQPEEVLAQLREKAASGSDRQKYAAFCLIGQAAPRENAALTDLCRTAVRTETHPGVIAAARWAAQRLGHDEPWHHGERVFVDDLTGLAFAYVAGTESFHRGSPPDERDRFANEQQAAAGRPIQSVYFATTELAVGALARFLEDPDTVQWLGQQASASAELRGQFQLAGEAWQGQIARGALDEAAGWISLDLARRYCEWASLRGAQASPARRYRLPTEDEWEYACRAGNAGRFCFGDGDAYVPLFAHCSGHVAGPPAVGLKMPNFHGLFDTHGSLWEWTDSRYPPELVSDADMDAGLRQNLYVYRGGAYYSPAVRCRSAQRNYGSPHWPDMYKGLRVVMEVVER